MQVCEYSALVDFSAAERADTAARLELVQKLLRTCRMRSSEELLQLVGSYSNKLAQFHSMQGV